MRLLSMALITSAVCLPFCLLAGCASDPRLEDAQRLENQGKYLQAAGVYEELLASSKATPKAQSDLNIHLGEALLHTADSQEAFAAFSRAVELDSLNVQAH